MKKLIAAMTVGKDVSGLFVDVVKTMQTQNLELKKMVYLYIMNYAKTMPEKAILAVSTFTRDATSHNPLIRALAIRTMGCIRVGDIVEYMADPLRTCLGDPDPYVRKTAAVCVAKLYDLDPELAVDQGFVDLLINLVGDANPMVVSNAVAALGEISDGAPEPVFAITPSILKNVLAALSECNEWGQIFLLDALVRFSPRDSREAVYVAERVTPHLQHANPAVVLGAVKVILLFINVIGNQEFIKGCMKKMAPPLCSLVSAEHEIAYVALRNINLIIEAYPLILRNEIARFFCKYDDPQYLKVQKLEIILKLVSARNVSHVLSELMEYAVEVDVTFVRKAIVAIGRTAVKLPDAAPTCVKALIKLIDTSQANESHMAPVVVQSVVLAMRDIFRRYPGQFERVLGILCENLDWVSEPEPLAALIWIVGEYSEKIDASVEMVEDWLDDWAMLASPIRYALLTTAVKTFLTHPGPGETLVTQILELATEDGRDPDLRDRAYIYWRLLSTNPDAARSIVCSERPLIRDMEASVEPSLLHMLLAHISSLASVYHKTPDMFVAGSTHDIPVSLRREDNDDEESDDGAAAADAAAAVNAQPTPTPTPPQPTPTPTTPAGPTPSLIDVSGPAAPPPASGGGGSLLDLLSGTPATTTTTTPNPPAPPASGGGSLLDLMGGGAPPPSSVSMSMSGASSSAAPAGTSSGPSFASPKVPLLDATSGKGLEVSGCFARNGNTVSLVLDLTNKSMAGMNQFALQFNKNTFGFGLGAQLGILVPSLAPGASTTASVPLTMSGAAAVQPGTPVDMLQVAIKNQVQVFYFQIKIPLFVLFDGAGNVDRGAFLSAWKAIPETSEAVQTLSVPSPLASNFDAVSPNFLNYNVFPIASRVVDDGTRIAFFSAHAAGSPLLAEFKISPAAAGEDKVSVQITVRSSSTTLHSMLFTSLNYVAVKAVSD